MPLYEYQCPQCGRFELIQKFADPPLVSCPTCSSAVEKLLSAPAIQFKGSGWYITDYARKSSSSEGGGKTESAKSDGGKSDGAKAEPAKSSDSSTASSSSTASAGGASSGTAAK